MPKISVFILSIILFASCQSNSPQGAKPPVKKLGTDSLAVSVEQDHETSCNNDYVKYKKIRSKTFYYPIIHNSKGEIEKFNFEMLIPNVYHEDEIDPTIKKLNWIGLFQNNKGLYLKKAKLKIDMHVHDDLFDTIGGANTGIDVSISANKDNCFLLFQGNETLKEGIIEFIPFGSFSNKSTYSPYYFIAPDKPYSFTFNQKKYTLFAAAGKFINHTNYFEAKHYQLYLGIGDKPFEHNQLLSFDPDLSGDFDPIVSIDFIGDLDGDGKPDLIIDCGDTMKYLFLSSGAEAGKLLRLAGAFSYWFGC